MKLQKRKMLRSNNETTTFSKTKQSDNKLNDVTDTPQIVEFQRALHNLECNKRGTNTSVRVSFTMKSSLVTFPLTHVRKLKQ